MPEHTANAADAVEVRGHSTDPKRAGFQVLTNYECLYWRALVGNDAWGLYEVLRSFCHEGATACFPSIRYLKDILGFKDKRALIGRKKIVQGRKYEYPGMIDILQGHDLIVAEVTGEKPHTSYVFHVNLTPGLLAAKQVRQLSPLLQEKHEALVARIAAEVSTLDAKKRTKRFTDPERSEPSPDRATRTGAKATATPKNDDGKFPSRLWEIPQRGVGNSHPNITHPPKPSYHHHRQPDDAQNPVPTSSHDASASGDDEVVTLLISYGVTPAIAAKLAKAFSQERINRQIRNLQHRTERGEPIKGNRGGKLRAMIENDWPFLDNYRSPEAIAQEKQRQAEASARAEAEQAKQQAELESSRQERKRQLQEIRVEMGVSNDICEAWESRKKRLKQALPAQEYMFFVGSYLLGVEGTTAAVGVYSPFIRERLQKDKLHARLIEELGDMLPEVNAVDVVILDEALAGARKEDAQPEQT